MDSAEICLSAVADTLEDILEHPTLPVFNITPDARISVLPNLQAAADQQNISWMSFWSSARSYRTLGDSPFPEDQLQNEPNPMGPVSMPITSWDDNGRYLNSVFRLNETTLVSFFHAEVQPGADMPALTEIDFFTSALLVSPHSDVLSAYLRQGHNSSV